MATSPITSGATVMMPSASDEIQCCHMIPIGTVEPWKTLNPTIPPMPETMVPMIAAATRPRTWLSLPRVKPLPK